VDHLRWDLKQMFHVAVAEGVVITNPAMLLFTPSECNRPEHQTMTLEDRGYSTARICADQLSYNLLMRSFCGNALKNGSQVVERKERETGIEPATSSLGI
jgi:hypothetical protein